MTDLLGPGSGAATKRDIVVLRSLESFPKAADFTEQRGAINTEMIQIILPEEEFGVPVRFKERIGSDVVRIEKIFVRINDRGFGVASDFAGDLGQRIFRELIILIEQSAPLAASEG